MIKISKEVYWSVQDVKTNINEMTLGEASFFSPPINYDVTKQDQWHKVVIPDELKFFELHHFIGRKTKITIETIE